MADSQNRPQPKMVDAQRHVRNVPKDAHNTFHGYSYTSAEKMLEVTREALLSAGIAVMATDVSLVEGAVPPMVQVTFERSGDGPVCIDTCQWPIIESKGRPFDKAYAAAVTTAVNYYLRGLLLVPRTDVEVDTRDDTQHVPEPRGIYATTTIDLAKALADHPDWSGKHTVNEVLVLGESRIKDHTDEAMAAFIESSIARLNKGKEATSGRK